MKRKKIIFLIVMLALLPLCFITGKSSWLIVDEVTKDIDNRYYPVMVADDYEGVYNGEYHTVTPKDASSSDVIYDKNKASVEYHTVSSTGEVAKDALGHAPVNAGSYAAVTIYDGEIIGKTNMVIKPFPIYVVANDSSLSYGDSYTIDSGAYKYCTLNGDSFTEVSLFTNVLTNTLDELTGLELKFNTNYKDFDAPGNYNISIEIQKQSTNKNYTVTPGNGALSVSKRDVTLSWSDLEFIYDGMSHLPTLTIDNNISDDAHKLKLNITGDGTDAGSYIATANGDNPNYNISGSRTQEFKILQRDLFTNGAKWDNTTFSYDGSPHTPSIIFDNLVNGDDVTPVYEYYNNDGMLLTGAPTKVGSYKVVVKGIEGAKAKNYSFSQIETPFVINKGTPVEPSVVRLQAKVGELITSITLPANYTLDGYTNEKFTTPGEVRVNVIYNPNPDCYNDLKTTVIVDVKKPNVKYITVSLKSEAVTYDGNVHHPSYTTYINGVEGALPTGCNITFTYKDGTFTSPVDAGEYKIYSVSINNIEGYEFDRENSSYKGITVTISPKELFIANGLELDYAADIKSYTGLCTKMVASLALTDSSGNSVALTANDFHIKGMHNGVYKYGSLTDKEALEAGGTNVIGSTYQVFIELDNSNYIISNNSFLLKYKTAIAGGKKYTIEDAINIGTGQITLCGDSSSSSSYVATSFTALSPKEGNPYVGTKFVVASRELLVPYSTATDNRSHDDTQNTNVYSALIVPKGITLEFVGNSILSIGGVIIHTTAVKTHGVVINEGTIVMQSGTKIDSYGYLKGRNGLVDLRSGSMAVDCMKLYNWPGGSIASSIYKTVFPISSWTLHNISCETKINSGAEYQACAYIVASKIPFEKFITVLGTGSSSNYLFKPTGANGYITKKSYSADLWIKNGSGNKDTLYTITGSNQIEGQKDDIVINGNYIDGNLQLKINAILITVDISTSLTKPCPLPFVSVVVRDGSHLSLTKSDYLFLPGTRLEIENGAVVNTGSGVDLTFATMQSLKDKYHPESDITFVKRCVDKADAKLILNGELNVQGNIGGCIESSVDNAILNISAGNSTSSFIVLDSLTSGREYFSNTVTATGVVGTAGSNPVPLENKAYISTGVGKDCHWVGADQVTEFTFNFYDGDVLLGTKTLNVVNNTTYTITGNEYYATKKHMDFVKWVDSNDPNTAKDMAGRVITGPATINMYATWTDHIYKLVYAAGYGYDSSNNPIYVEAKLNNVIDQFTYKDFVDGRINITTTASYTDPETNKDKFFNGWFFGVDKTIGIKTNVITIEMLDTILEKVPGIDEIPLFCEFTDTQVYNISVIDNTNALFNKAFNIEAGQSLADIQAEIKFDSSTLDEDMKYGFYFNGFVDSLGNRYTMDELLNTKFKSDAIVKLLWSPKAKVTLKFEDQNDIIFYVHNQSFNLPSVEELKANNIIVNRIIGNNGDNSVIYQTLARYNVNGTNMAIGTEMNLTSDAIISAVTNNVTYYKLEIVRVYQVNLTITATNGNILESVSAMKFATTVNPPVGTEKADVNIKYYVMEGATISFSPTYNDSTYRGFKITNQAGKEVQNFKPPHKRSEPPKVKDITNVDQAYRASFSSGDSEGCITAETLITMADGNKKMAKDINVGELVLVFNHETGSYEIAPVIVNAHEEVEWRDYLVTHLFFNDGTNLSIINEHELFDLDLNRYVVITYENANDYIGHRFYAASFDGRNYVDREIILTGFENKVEYTGIYGPFTAYHMNCFTEEILTLPGEIHGLYNIFEFGEGLKYDEAKMKADIDKYGLYTYDDFKEYVSIEVFELLPAPYFKVAVGKGMVTYDQLINLADKYMRAYNKYYADKKS